MFYAKYPSNSKIKWLANDSDPEYAIERHFKIIEAAENEKNLKIAAESKQNISVVSAVQDYSDFYAAGSRQASSKINKTSILSLNSEDNIDFEASRKKNKKRRIVDETGINSVDLKLED